MHINAFLREITRMRLLITGGFRGRPIQRRHFWLQGSNGRFHGHQILAKIGQKITKMAITSVVCNISMQGLFCDMGFVLSRNSSVTLLYARNKGALPWQPIFGKNRQNITKWPQRQLYASYSYRVWFWDRVSAIDRGIHLWHSVHNWGTKAHYHDN